MNKAKIAQEIIEHLSRCQRPAGMSGWKKLGLSHAQVGMLFMLSYHQDASVNQIADFLGITKSAVTQLLEPLVDKSLVTRRSDPKDKRIARLSLSAKGKSQISKIAKLKSAGLRSALTSLDYKDLEQMRSLLLKMSLLSQRETK